MKLQHMKLQLSKQNSLMEIFDLFRPDWTSSGNDTQATINLHIQLDIEFDTELYRVCMPRNVRILLLID